MEGAMAADKSRQRTRTDTVLAPVGAAVDLGALPLTALVSRLSQRLVQALAATYQQHQLKTQPLDSSLLVLLSLGPARPTALAERLHASKQALSFVVDRLERDGYLTRTPDPSDRRAKVLTLTAAGEHAALITAEALREVEQQWRDRAGGPTEWPAIRAALARMDSIGM
jgi:DNA-binding MarR family transcriptional regulator